MRCLLFATLLFFVACQTGAPELPDLAGQGLNRGPLPPPEVVEDESWEVLEVLARSGPIYIAGQPSEADLERFAAEGVSVVVNIRTPAEMDNRQRVPFDEAAKVEELGMEYVHLPQGGDDHPYAPDTVDRFAEALARHEGKALLHCTVAWRASHLWAAYLVRYHGLELPEAIEHAKAINFGDMPLEGLLGEPLRLSLP